MRGGARPGAGRKSGIKTSPPTKALNIRIPVSMAEDVEKTASKVGITVSAWIRKTIEKALKS